MMRAAQIGVNEADAGKWLAKFAAAAPHPKAHRSKIPAVAQIEPSTPVAEIQHDNSTEAALYAGDKVSLVSKPEITGTTSPPSLPLPGLKLAKAKPIRIISAYAGTSLHDLKDFEPTLSEVLAADNHGIETKAFAKALETLAMWRALYGDDALAYGLEQAANHRAGHRYAGPCAKGYTPERGSPRRYESEPNGLYAEQERMSALPTVTDLVEAGIAKPLTAAEAEASRPAWFNAELAQA